MSVYILCRSGVLVVLFKYALEFGRVCDWIRRLVFFVFFFVVA